MCQGPIGPEGIQSCQSFFPIQSTCHIVIGVIQSGQSDGGTCPPNPKMTVYK